MSDISQLMLGAGANDLFAADLQSKMRTGRFVSGIGEPDYLPTFNELTDLGMSALSRSTQDGEEDDW